MNLSVLRKGVQIIAFIVLVYGVGAGGYYLADKISASLPALSCAFDMKSADYCALIPFQHQMDHRVGMAMAAGGDVLQSLVPTLITLGTFVLLFVFLNKAFCGWICPLGFFQEVMNMIGTKLGLQQQDSVSEKSVKRMRPIKWFILVFFVFFFPLLTGLGYVGHELGDPYCRICPSRILTTLAVGDTDQLVIDSTSDGYMIWSLIATFMFGLIMAIGLTVRQPFCRICPMLALHAVFRKIGLVRLVKNAKPRCEKCGICAKECPMDISEIHTEMEKKDVLYADCTLCGRCVEFCPDKDVLQLKYAVIPVFSADPAYFKKRKKGQTTWVKHNLLSWWRNRKQNSEQT